MSSSSAARPPAKRARTDPVIGLDVGGKVHFCRRSTLSNGYGSTPSYFSARFGPESLLSPEVDRVDEHGHEIYFVDRNPGPFGLVLDYLRMRELPPELGTFRENPNAWRALRREADFFSLDGLASLLQVTFRCSPGEDGGKGVLYYLGTNGGKEEYVNPYARKIIDVTGHVDDIDSHDDLDNTLIALGTNKARENFVQYRLEATAEEISSASSAGMVNFDTLLYCDDSSSRWPVVIDLRKKLVSPTHYSLRHGGCYGMSGKWNFDASVDGENWVLLHAGNGEDAHNCSSKKLRERRERGEEKLLTELLDKSDEEEVRKAHCDYMERHYRHTWEVDRSGDFYRYFRIIGADEPDEFGCLHCVGLELYGSVFEE